MSAERTLTDADVDAIADALYRRLMQSPPAPPRPPTRRQRPRVEVSETDRAAARAVARRLGLLVREPGDRR